jgi:nickel transport protein
MKSNKGKRPQSILACLPFQSVIYLYILLLTASIGYAHNVYIFAWVEGDTIYTESYFGGDKRVNEGLIRVLDLTGKELLKGKTNEMGEFSFKIPQKADMRIILEASMGHKAEYLFKAEEFSDTAENAHKEEADTDADKIRAMIEEVIDSRLSPISRKLAGLEKNRGPGLTEVIGGIGYIFGIMGLIMYLKARKK